MGPERERTTGRLLFVLCLVGWAVLLLWAWQKPIHPNSDRYDYAARAQSLSQGRGLAPQLDYPLRLAVGDAPSIPAPNRTRTPLWPLLLVPTAQAGLGEHGPVLLAGLFALGVALLLWRVGDQSHGAPAGAFAAAVWMSSFATARGIHGGGPELAMALLLLLCWSWTPALHGPWGYLACGTLYGLMPLLHPLGLLFAFAAFVARGHRYSGRGRLLVLAAAVAVGAPWHVWMASQGGLLQNQAELAKSLFDAGGLGPYRGLEPASNLGVAMEHPAALARTVAARLQSRLWALDALLPWAAVAAGLWGVRRDPRLAIRDLSVGLGCGLVLCAFSWEARPWLPLLPVAAVWAGAGAQSMRSSALRWSLPLLCVASWFLPLGRAATPTSDLRGAAAAWLSPSSAAAAALATAAQETAPIATDSAALAWRAGRHGLILPEEPRVLRRIRRGEAGAGIEIVALAEGPDSAWLAKAPAAWDSLLDRSEIVFDEEGGTRIYRLPMVDEDPPAAIEQIPVDRYHTLPLDYAPAKLIELPSPPASRAGIRVTPETWDALQSMLDAAREDGIVLRVISGHRSAGYQRQLYERAIATHGEDQQWVAAPGQSEHQLGSTMDLADAALAHSLEQSFGQTPEGSWLRENCERFGFRISYTAENQAETGILPEPWHIRYWGRP